MKHHCRNKLAFLIACIAGVIAGWPESASAMETDIGELAAPSSPAFTILGIAPSEISRPVTPRAFLISIADIIDKDGIPSDFALDIAPYWWSSHPKLTFDEYRNSRGFLEAALQTLSVSIGTDRLEDDLGSNIGLGARLNLLNGAGVDSRVMDDLIDRLHRMHYEALILLKEVGYKGPVADSIQQALIPVEREISRLSQERVDFRLELASACAISIPHDQWDSADVYRWGVWLTGSYRGYNSDSGLSPLTFIAAGRYSRRLNADVDPDAVDIGGRLVWEPVAVPVNLSIEYMSRFADEYTYQTSLLAEYIIDDDMILYATLGKAFEDENLERNDLFTTLGISFGCGRQIRNFN